MNEIYSYEKMKDKEILKLLKYWRDKFNTNYSDNYYSDKEQALEVFENINVFTKYNITWEGKINK